MLTIGSVALRAHYPQQLATRKPQDTDFIARVEEWEAFVAGQRQLGCLKRTDMFKHDVFIAYTNHGIYEFNIAWPGTTNEEILDRHKAVGKIVATPDTLLLLKLSHRYRRNSPHFLKTMRDIQFLREQGVYLSQEYVEILKRREEETYTYAHPKLNQSKGAFFTDTIKYVYDHDSIHEAVAVGDRPAYQFAKKDLAEVQMSRKKFAKLPPEVQLLMPLEESYVLAIERSLVPHPGALTPRQAFEKALMKVCTSITSGWFREFSWENYDKVLALYDESYWTKFNTALEAGRILPFQQGEPQKMAA